MRLGGGIVFKNVWKLLPVFIITTLILITGGCTSEEPAEKLSEVRLVGTMGPLSIPLAYMVENNVMESVAETTTMEIWATPVQLQAIIGSGQAEFMSLPTNSAATFYNKDIQLKLLDCSIWNILFLVSTDPTIATIEDLAGKRVVVPYQGAVPDAIFRYNLTKHGINPDTDIELYYAPDPVQASQSLLSGQETCALLSEPSATSVIKKGAESGLTIYRNLDMNHAWQSASDGSSRSAIAGTVALNDMAENDEVIDVFMTEYEKAVEWMLAHPREAGELGARVLEEQGFSAAVLTESLENIDWDFSPASDVRDDIEHYFNALMELSPDFTGGTLPDEDFYYGR